MAPVRLLPDELINRIAAGEVVERPASILKELLENSLDAGADRIDVVIEAGGRKLVSVADNGSGMDGDDLLLAVERHATSKLSADADLMHIGTLGFRGEALPSIASVSRMTIVTASGDDGSGRMVRLSGGRLMDTAAAARDRGTTVEAADLFFNVPARRKFLKSPTTEAAHLLETAQRYALSRNDLRLSYTHNGQETLRTSPAEDDLSRLARVLGRETARQMFPFDETSGDYSCRGYLGRPDTNRSRPSSVYMFVNDRPVSDRLLLRAVMEAYRGRLPSGRYPAAVFFIDLDPELVDVNVHPAKAQVRFRHPNQAFDAASGAVGRALDRTLRPVAPARPNAPDYEQQIRPQTGSTVGEVSFWSNRAAGPGFFPSRTVDYRPVESGPLDLGPTAPPHTGPAADVPPQGLRPVGQIFRSYILAQGPDALFVVDQHAAHERILFEKLRARMQSGGLPGQGFLTPLTIETSPVQAALMERLVKPLARCGFELEPFGGTTFMLRSAPSNLAGRDAQKVLMEIIDAAAEEDPEAGIRRLEETVCESLACHQAIKAGDAMTFSEMDSLLKDLDETQAALNCPHGRPLIFEISRREIEKKFDRG